MIIMIMTVTKTTRTKSGIDLKFESLNNDKNRNLARSGKTHSIIITAIYTNIFDALVCTKFGAF